MLTRLFIADFAIVSQLELSFAPGMTTLTGETGAGKSILIHALGLTLGDRADADTIRHGKDKCEVSAWFELAPGHAALDWLNEHDLSTPEHANECQIRRIVLREGRSRAYINNRPVPIQSLKDLGQLLVDIHGQHEHQSLLHRDQQRGLVDQFGHHQALLKQTQQCTHQYQQIEAQLRALHADGEKGHSYIELLRYQVEELQNFAVDKDEYTQLMQELNQLSHAEQIRDTCTQALQTLYDADEVSVNALLGKTLHALEQARTYTDDLAPIIDLINNALIQTEESTSELRHFNDTLESDPQRLEWIEKRLQQMIDLARKHHVEPQQLYEFGITLEQTLTQALTQQTHITELQQAREEIVKQFHQAAKKLSKQRIATAAKLCAQINPVIHSLGMPGAQLSIAVEPQHSTIPTPLGADQVNFLVSTNPGTPPKPLHKVASGGELSRISLAIQVIATDAQAPETFVFDEVDTGVGGAVAEIVGKQLRALSHTRQIICITHLAQVAVQAHQQMQVAKSQRKGNTQTQISPLDEQQRSEEIARMLGGATITAQTRKHALELLAQANSAAKPNRIRKTSTTKRKAS